MKPSVLQHTAHAANLSLLTVAFLAAVSPRSEAAALSLNFASGPDIPGPPPSYLMDAAESAGVVPLTNWNNLTGASASVSNLVNDSGIITSAMASWTSNGTWETDITVSAGDFKMMKTHLDARASGFPAPLDATVTVSGIPSGISTLYDVYVYFDAVTADGTVLSNYTIGSQTFYTSDTATFNGTFTQATGTTPETRSAGANYVKFSGLTGDSFTLVADSENFRAEISGIQIVAVPEPGSSVLIAMGGLLALARRRSRSAIG